MANNYDIIKFRRGLRTELSNNTLQTGEPGFTTDTNQLFIGIDDAINELIVDPFPNAHKVVQDWLDNNHPGLLVDEDLVIRQIDPNDIDGVLADMHGGAPFGNYVRPRKNVEVITENSFNQLFADQHLGIYDLSDGRRSSLYQKELSGTSGTFALFRDGVSMAAPSVVYVDYSIKQTNADPAAINPGPVITYVRVGTLKVINGNPHGLIGVSKVTDENTEIWQDDGNGVAEFTEFSNIEFASQMAGNDLVVSYTQWAGFVTTVTYTIKRWTM